MTSSGTSGYGQEYADFVDLSALGAFVTKSVTPEERKGNEPARIIETRAGMLNAIGLANVGLERFCAEKIAALDDLRVPIIVNIAGHSIDDYIKVAQRLDGYPVIRGLELNVSCPNVTDGLTFGTNAKRLGELVSAVRDVVKQSLLIVKLSPNVTDITKTAAAAIDAGAECLSLVNTFSGMAIDVEKQRPMLANLSGGLSGPAIRPLAVYMVHRVYHEVAKSANIPLIGMGGIQTPNDALEFILAGASAVGVGTALFVNPATPIKIIGGLKDYCHRHKIDSLTELVGALQLDKSGPGSSSVGY